MHLARPTPPPRRRRQAIVLLAALAVLAVVDAANDARGAVGAGVAGFPVCLPPLYLGGRRLHPAGEFEVAVISLLLAQHEVCWRDPDSRGEKRIFLVGNSNVWGHPLPVAESYSAIVQDRLDQTGLAAHLFNLGFFGTYQLKDALILGRALDFAPDLIVYGASLADSRHVVPLLWPPAIVRFFEVNARLLVDPDAPTLAGLEQPARVYAAASAAEPWWLARWVLLRELGRYVRAVLRGSTQELLMNRLVHASSRATPVGKAPGPLLGSGASYSCTKVEERFATDFANWQDWSILPSLESLQRHRGIPVLVVNWPLAHVPRETCYSSLFPAHAVEAFNEWLERETRRRGLAYLDLHDLLPPDAFTDPLHLDAEGQTRLADALAAAIEGWLRSRSFEASPVPVHQ